MTQAAGLPAHGDLQPELRQQVQRFGHAAASSQVLRPGYLTWWNPTGDACLAYVDTGGAWVVAGEPLVARERRAEVAEQFRLAAKRARRRVVFFAVEQVWPDDDGWSRLLIGRQPTIHPQQWGATLRRVRSLREQLRRARSHQVVVREVTPEQLRDPRLRAGLSHLVDRWRASKAMPPMVFLVRLHSPWQTAEQHLFVARRGGECVGFAIVVPLQARNGALLEHLIRAPSAPNGTTELLVDSVIRDAASRGLEHLTLGLAPLAGEVGPVLDWFRRRGAALYDFAGLERYKAKFRPHTWEPVYLSIPRGDSRVRALYEVLKAFAGEGLVNYGFRAVLRGPPVVLRGLAVLLVPWILGLLLCDAEAWFPVAWMREFWVVFDVLVGAALLALSRNFHRNWGEVLSWFLLFDATATLVLALRFNAPRVTGPLDAAVVLAASLAPWLAWLVVVGAGRRATRA